MNASETFKMRTGQGKEKAKRMRWGKQTNEYFYLLYSRKTVVGMQFSAANCLPASLLILFAFISLHIYLQPTEGLSSVSSNLTTQSSSFLDVPDPENDLHSNTADCANLSYTYKIPEIRGITYVASPKALNATFWLTESA